MLLQAQHMAKCNIGKDENTDEHSVSFQWMLLLAAKYGQIDILSLFNGCFCWLINMDRCEVLLVRRVGRGTLQGNSGLMQSQDPQVFPIQCFATRKVEKGTIAHQALMQVA